MRLSEQQGPSLESSPQHGPAQTSESCCDCILPKVLQSSAITPYTVVCFHVVCEKSKMMLWVAA